MEELLDALLRECQPYTAHGKVATYIPELAKGDPSDLGIYVLRSDGRHYQAGSYRKHFTIQSVVKPILLLLALLDNGEEVVRAKVGVEKEGEKKNLISTIESERNDKRTYAMGKLLKTMCRGDSFGLPRFWAVLWAKLRFPVAAVAGYFALFFLYALSQDGRQPWRNIWPGTMAALGAWLALNWLYSTYVENFADYSLLYGSIGTAIALLIWLYMTAVTLIMGAELNATLISLRKDRAGES